MAIATIGAPAGPGHEAEVAVADEGENRTNALLSLAVTLPKVTRRTLGRHGLAEGGLVTDWAAVVGETIAERSLLLRLSFTGGGGPRGAGHGADSGAAACGRRARQARSLAPLNAPLVSRRTRPP